MLRQTRRTAALAVCAAVVLAAIGPADAQALTATRRTTVRPVTASGHPAPGYRVSSPRGESVDCSYPEPSPAAVNRNILFCSPDAEYAVACWKSARKHHVLCLRDPRKRRLVSLPVTASIAHTKPFRLRAPLALVLGNGVYCTFRDGGTAPELRVHPSWAVYYYCTHGLAIWGPQQSANWALNRGHAIWKARVAAADGSGTLVTRNVRRAWLVGAKR